MNGHEARQVIRVRRGIYRLVHFPAEQEPKRLGIEEQAPAGYLGHPLRPFRRHQRFRVEP